MLHAYMSIYITVLNIHTLITVYTLAHTYMDFIFVSVLKTPAATLQRSRRVGEKVLEECNI